MIRIRSWVLLNALGLMIVSGLGGCGSSQTTGTVTSVSNTTTTVANPNAAKPPMGHGAPAGMAMAPPVHGANPGAGPSGPAGTMDPAAMMKAHGSATPPGGAHGAAMPPGGPPAGRAMDPAMMKPPGGATPPGGAPAGVGMDPAMMKAHGSATPPGGAPAGAGMDPAAMKGHGAAAPPGGAPAGAAMDPAAMMRGQGSAAAPNGDFAGGGMGPGGAGGPGGQGRGSNFAAGSVEDSIYRFCVAMADGDTAAAAEYLFPKAKGLVGQLREGELSEEKVEEIKNAVSPVNELQPNPSQTNTKRSLRNKKNQVISFVMKKDKDDEDKFKIVELSISKPKSR